MRYLAAKPRPRKKRLIRQPSAATFSHRRRHICPPLTCRGRRPDDPQRPFSRQPSVGNPNHRSTPCLLLLEKGDRVAVDEEVMRYLIAKSRQRKKRLIRQPSAATFSHRRRHISPPLPCRGRRPRRPATPILPPTFCRQSQPPLRTFAFSRRARSAQALIPTKSRKTKSAPPNLGFGGAP